MPSITCPACGRSLWLPPSRLGQAVVCPACDHRWTVVEEVEPEPEANWGRRTQHDLDHEREEDTAFFQDAPRRDLIPHRGVLVLLLGVSSLCLSFLAPVGILLGLAAWVMAQGDLAQMRRQQMDPEGHFLTLGGLITGIIGLVLSVVILLACAGVWSVYYSNRPGLWGPGPGPFPGRPPAPGPINPGKGF